ncbi:MAG: DNA polymerase III subunit delta [Clostridia bacterium]
MKWSDFFTAIDEGKVQKAYLFTGPEGYIKRAAVEKMREKMLPSGLEALNEAVLEDVGAQQITEACETLPFMADKRLVLVRDWAPLLSGRTGDEAQAERMIEWLKGAPESCCLVFWMRESADLRRKLGAALVKMGADVRFDYLEGAELDKWVRAQAKKLDATFHPDALRQLTFLAGASLARLDGEVRKLCAYAGPGGTVTRAAVEALVTPSLEAKVFQMIDCLMARDMARVMTMTKTMLEAGEARLGILAMLTRQMRLMTHISRMLAAGQMLPQVESALGIKGYPARRMAEQARKFTQAQLEAGYRACVDADYRIKSGRARDDAALDELLFTLGSGK